MKISRSYLRHPSDIPIDILPAQVDAGDTRPLVGTPTRLLYTGTAATRATFDTVTRDLKPIALRVRLPIGRAGACRRGQAVAAGSSVRAGVMICLANGLEKSLERKQAMMSRETKA